MFPLIKSPEQTVIGAGIDFASRLATGETILSFTVSDGGSGIASGASISGTKIICNLTGGTSGQQYIVTFSIVGSLGTQDSGQIVVYVIPNAGICTISINLKTLGLQPVANSNIVATTRPLAAKQGSIIVDQPITVTTDINGYAEMVVAQGVVVTFLIPLLKNKITVDTTGKNTIELADTLV